MKIFKFFKKEKQADLSEEGLKVYLDFELKTFKFLTVDNFTSSEQISLIIIEDILKSGTSVSIYGEEISKFNEISIKKLSSLFLIIKMHQSNITMSQRKLNFYESPSKIMQTKEKNLDYYFVFSLKEINLIGGSVHLRKNSAKNNCSIKKKKVDVKNFDEEYIRSGNLKKKSKKGDFVEKIFALFKDKLVYYEPKDKGFFYFPFTSFIFSSLRK